MVDQFQRRLVELNMDSAEELQSYIHKLSMNLELNRQRSLLQEALDNRAEVGVCKWKGARERIFAFEKNSFRGPPDDHGG